MREGLSVRHARRIETELLCVFRSLARLIYFGGAKNELPGADKRGVVLETISLSRRIALTGTDEDKATAEQMLGSANEKLKKLTNSKEE